MVAKPEALRDRFLAALPPERRSAYATWEDLAPRLEALVQAGQRAWPDLGVEQASFVEVVAGSVRSELEPDLALEEIRTEDLYLATACADRRDAALRAFEARFFPDLGPLFERWRAYGVTKDDFLQSVRERLFLGDPPRIATYAGRGSLRSWVRMVGSRLLTDAARRRVSEPDTVSHDDGLLTAMTPDDDPTSAFLKTRYREEVQGAIDDALTRLTPRARNVLRQRYVYGLQLDEIAGLYGIHKGTASRWVSKARAEVLTILRGQLAQRLGTAKLDVDSILRLCATQLELSLDRLLASRTSP